MRRTAQERADWIRSKFAVRFNRLMQEAADLLESDESLAKRGRRLVEITDDLAATVAPHAACRAGCSHCCHQAVTITQYEADTIGAAIGVEPLDVPQLADTPSAKAMQDTYTGIVCPFLVGGRCSIYPVRPIACRTLFNLDDDPELCNMQTHPGGTVPYFNFRPLQMIAGVMAFNADAPVADIRAFFPKGRG